MSGDDARARGAPLPAVVLPILLLVSLLACVALMPADWIAQVRGVELNWLYKAQGEASTSAILERASAWHNGLCANPTDPGWGVGALAGSPANSWLSGRIEVLSSLFAQGLQRIAVLFAWWPYLLLFLSAALCEGLLRRRIRRQAFSYDSPLVHQTTLVALSALTVLFVALLFAPIPLLALGVPVLGALYARLISAAVSHAQKQL